jgi:hypothetical protein
MKSRITPWSTLTTENLFETDQTFTPFFWYKNELLSLFNLFNLCKWLITGHKQMATFWKMMVYFKKLALCSKLVLKLVRQNAFIFSCKVTGS